MKYYLFMEEIAYTDCKAIQLPAVLVGESNNYNLISDMLDLERHIYSDYNVVDVPANDHQLAGISVLNADGRPYKFFTIRRAQP